MVQLITVFYSFLYFLSTSLHVLLTLSTPSCNITSFRWSWALHLRLMLQFGHIIIVYLYHVQQLVPFDVTYALSWQSCICFLLALEYVQHDQVHVYELACATKTQNLTWVAFCYMFGLSLICWSFIYNL